MVAAWGVFRKLQPSPLDDVGGFLANAQGARENANAGEVAEWSNAAVLKTAVRLRGPGVRIPPSPPSSLAKPGG